MHPITILTDYEKNRIAGDNELFSRRNQQQAGGYSPLCCDNAQRDSAQKGRY